MSNPTEMELLQEGIAVAKTGNKTIAISLLLRVTSINPKNETAWLWLAHTTENTADKIAYFRHALAINPTREQVKIAFKELLMKEAITTVKGGNKEQAHSLFWEVVEIDPLCEPAWLWLASVGKSQSDTVRYLEQALAINPKNQNAKAWLLRIKPEGLPEPIQISSPETAETSTVHTSEAVGRSVQPEPVQSKEPAEEKVVVSMPAQPVQPPPPVTRIVEEICKGIVLTVDDSAIVRKAVVGSLEKEGYKVLEAASGMDALSILKEITPDLVLLDITMPIMDGYEVCKLIKKSPELKSLPVVMLSGKDGFFDKVKGKLAGSNEYITKPFEPNTLLKTVRKYCVKERVYKSAIVDVSPKLGYVQ